MQPTAAPDKTVFFEYVDDNLGQFIFGPVGNIAVFLRNVPFPVMRVFDRNIDRRSETVGAQAIAPGDNPPVEYEGRQRIVV